MCGRFSLTTSADLLVDVFQLAEVPPISPRYNIAPTQLVSAIRAGQGSGDREFTELRWGLIPSWAKEPAIGLRLINARAETVLEKPAFRSAMRRRRCLIPADGFYEWQKIPGSPKKQPWYIHMKEAGLFAFAGLWERWSKEGFDEIESCTIITTTPNALINPLHDRMPVILDRSHYDDWLDPNHQDTRSLLPLLTPYDAAFMTSYPVGTFVNNPLNDEPACLEPKR